LAFASGVSFTTHHSRLAIDDSRLKNIYSVSTLKKLPKKSA